MYFCSSTQKLHPEQLCLSGAGWPLINWFVRIPVFLQSTCILSQDKAPRPTGKPLQNTYMTYCILPGKWRISWKKKPACAQLVDHTALNLKSLQQFEKVKTRPNPDDEEFQVDVFRFFNGANQRTSGAGYYLHGWALTQGPEAWGSISFSCSQISVKVNRITLVWVWFYSIRDL